MHEQPVLFPVVAQARAEGAQHRAHRDVGAVELVGHSALQRYADAGRTALDDQRAVLDPYPVGQPRQEWIGRREDAAVRHVRHHVARKRPAVE
ncbi:MAG: hypothetical protein WAN39_11795 [Candidatus Cybelea sp.]